MMMMQLAKNKSPSTSTLDDVNSLNSSISPPPKPNRNGNMNKLVDFSPSKMSSSINKRNYPLKTPSFNYGDKPHFLSQHNVIIINRKDIEKKERDQLMSESNYANCPSLNKQTNGKLEKGSSFNSNNSTSSSLNNSQLKNPEFNVNFKFFKQTI